MVDIIDLNGALAGLRLIEDRTPSTTAAERREGITRLAPYRDGAIFASKFKGTGAWERHPVGEEIVQIVEGETVLHLMTAEGKRSLSLSSGMMVVVPRNMWHQFVSPAGVSLITATPQPTEHIEDDVA